MQPGPLPKFPHVKELFRSTQRHQVATLEVNVNHASSSPSSSSSKYNSYACCQDIPYFVQPEVFQNIAIRFGPSPADPSVLL
jgi:hypothetical protein